MKNGYVQFSRFQRPRHSWVTFYLLESITYKRHSCPQIKMFVVSIDRLIADGSKSIMIYKQVYVNWFTLMFFTIKIDPFRFNTCFDSGYATNFSCPSHKKCFFPSQSFLG